MKFGEDCMADDCVLSFDNDTLDFTLGVEVGILFRRLQEEPLPIEAVVHVENTEMVMRLAESMGMTVRSDDAGDKWLTVLFA